VGWQRRIHDEVIIYTALRDIGRDEELCISYGGPGVLWFPDADAEQVHEAQQREYQQQAIAARESGLLGSSGLANIDTSAD
jgi:SET domain-containing protein